MRRREIVVYRLHPSIWIEDQALFNCCIAGCDYIQARPNNPSVRLDERVTRSNTDANQKGKRTVLILSIHPSSCRMCKPKGGKLDAVRGMQGGSHSSHTRRTESSVSFVSLLEKKELVSKLTIYLLVFELV